MGISRGEFRSKGEFVQGTCLRYKVEEKRRRNVEDNAS